MEKQADTDITYLSIQYYYWFIIFMEYFQWRQAKKKWIFRNLIY